MTHNLYKTNFKNTDNLAGIDITKPLDKLRQEILNKEIEAISVVFNSDDFALFDQIKEEIKNFKNIVILGVGGSSLGAKTLCSLNSNHNITFLESIDPLTLKNHLNKIDFNESFFLVISKSGQTIETTCQTLIILDELKKLKINDPSKQFLFITQDEDSSLGQIAKEINTQIINHPHKIGGRYSVFSIVGLLPALLADLDIKKVRIGAQKIVNDFLNKEEISDSISTQLSLYEKGFVNNVMMPYIDNLENFNHWYRQLWAESLGKNNFGAIPVNSMGTVDQHSQLQLYLEGPKDKFFTFISLKNHSSDFLVKDLKNTKTLFGNKKLSDIVKIEEQTTIEVLNQKKLPIRIFEIANLNEEVLGGLMMQMFLETILIAYAKDINPFDQPAVELRKDLAKTLLQND